MKRKLKIGLLVNEFFAPELKRYNGRGGYGMLARNYITKYIPNDSIEIETIIGVNNSSLAERVMLDGTKPVIFFPNPPSGFGVTPALHWVAEKITRNPFYSTSSFLNKNNYDGYISIEMQGVSSWILNSNRHKKVILWLQDPRPQSDWDELDTLSISQNGYRPSNKTKNLIKKYQNENRLVVVTQAHFLKEKGRELYELNDDLQISYLPNPIEIDYSFNLSTTIKDNSIIFLGRLDSVKRPWIYYEIAKKCPQYNFYVCGKPHEDDFDSIIHSNSHIKNLIFLGHVDGEDKVDIIKKAKILVNTSIHEALPVSFLEALSYGCLLVSCQNPDNLTSKFGKSIPQKTGDGYELVNPFVEAINTLMEDDGSRISIAKRAISYIKKIHSIEAFQHNFRSIINETFRQ